MGKNISIFLFGKLLNNFNLELISLKEIIKLIFFLGCDVSKMVD